MGLCVSSSATTAKRRGVIPGTQLEKIDSCDNMKEEGFFSMNLLNVGAKTCDSGPQAHHFGLRNMQGGF